MVRKEKRVFRRDFNKPRENTWQDKKPRTESARAWTLESEKKNEDFDEYYQAQNIVPEGEWEDFLAALRKPLPVTFRINGSGKFADHLRDKLESDFFKQFGESTIYVDNEPVQPPRPLPWYPNNYAWHMDFSRGQLRKMSLLEEIHEFMKRANEAGSISRQEAVSMVPPLFMDVLPHHKVLDMCAAPGSKTFQLLEALHSGDVGGLAPTGFVVANDADFKRCNLLTHQTKRVCSPCLLVTNHGAESFPVIATPGGSDSLRFDRILCDVPCSGDGTMRKAPDIWRRWNVNSGNGLHVLQLRIALRGCQLLKVGGRMVYSTCTFNPIEDEAVVSEVLRRSKGAMRLVDVSDHLPKLKRLPGMTSWKVKDKFRWYDSWEDACGRAYKLDPSMFPKPDTETMNLHYTMRFLPHHQDTGGFFVCVLEKVAEMPEGLEAPTIALRSGAQPEAVDGGQQQQPQQQQRGAPAEEIKDPLEVARQAALAAIEAAERAVTALENCDPHGAGAGAGEAAKAAARAGQAQAAEQAAKRRAALAAAAASRAEAAKAAEASAGPSSTAEAMEEDKPAKAEEEGAGAGPGDMDTEGEEDAAATAAGERSGDEEEAGPADKAEGDAKAALWKPSWVRGGGARGRGGAAPGGKHRAIDPIAPVEDPAILDALISYYGLKADFPLKAQLITRSLEVARPKRLYFVSRSLLDLLLADEKEQLKITATGLKVFERQEIKDGGEACSYRLAQEGLPFILPYITKQRVQMSVQDFYLLVKERFLLFPSAVASGAAPAAADDAAAPAEAEAQAQAEEAGKAPEAAAAADAGAAPSEPQRGGRSKRPVMSDPLLLKALEDVRQGCFVVELRETEAVELGLATGADAAQSGALAANAPMALSAWRGKSSIAIMVEKAECTQIMDRLESALKRKPAATSA